MKNKKNILLLCDDIRMHSGIATMAREIVIGTSHKFNWFNLGAAKNHPEKGKLFDISKSVDEESGNVGSNVKVMPYSGYGDPRIIRKLIGDTSPDAIMIFTDPRYWKWLFDMEREIRSKIPIVYLNIWDNYPAPYYNKPFYDSCDGLMAISKQTKNINKLVLGDKAAQKIIRYVPHGVNPRIYYPLDFEAKDSSEYKNFKSRILNGKDYQFVILYNSRNLRRKNAADTIASFAHFHSRLKEPVSSNVALVMHTDPVDSNGTDLKEVRDVLMGDYTDNVIFSKDKLGVKEMNYLYNIADVSILLSSNEGWGLSLTESLMAGTPIIANVTGGMQDQMRFEDDNGNWYEPDDEVPSNHRGTYKKHGSWVEPIYPSAISLVGSVPTPYIYDDKCSPEDASDAIMSYFLMDSTDREYRGSEGRKWVLSDESGMNSNAMCENVIDSIEETINNFTPREDFNFHKITSYSNNNLNHNLKY